MVQLNFTVQVQANLEPVWQFYSNFSRITQWDPNTTACQTIQKNKQQVGSVYNITTLFNGKQSQVKYKTQIFYKNQNQGKIALRGQNDMITAYDQIICRKKGINKTEVQYRADICLRGIAKICTVFIICPLNKLAQAARVGCLNKARELWGKAE